MVYTRQSSTILNITRFLTSGSLSQWSAGGRQPEPAAMQVTEVFHSPMSPNM